MIWFWKSRIKDDLDRLKKSITNSFSNVKRDIKLLIKKDNEQDTKIEDIRDRLSRIELKLETVVPFEVKAEVKKEVKEGITEIEEDLIESLTNLQKSIFLKLSILMRETNNEWISMKSLTRELYPDKTYNRVRSIVSEYTDFLEEEGLIKKKRKGRKTYLTITKKGRVYVPKKVEEIKVKKKGR
jgi:ribosomal protein S19E (S16A)